MHLPEAFGPRVAGVQASDDGVVGATSFNVALCETALRVALTVALWLVLMDAVVAVKDASVEPAATLSEPGTVSIGLLQESWITAPPVGAASFRATLQVLDPFGPKLEGIQLIEAGLVTATRLIVAVTEMLSSEAVIVEV